MKTENSLTQGHLVGLLLMAEGSIVELRRNSSNWDKIVGDIVKLERKIFPKHESLATSFGEELKKKNAGLLYLDIHGEVVGYAMYSWPSSLYASITKLAGFNFQPHFFLWCLNLFCFLYKTSAFKNQISDTVEGIILENCWGFNLLCFFGFCIYAIVAFCFVLFMLASAFLATPISCSMKIPS